MKYRVLKSWSELSFFYYKEVVSFRYRGGPAVHCKIEKQDLTLRHWKWLSHLLAISVSSSGPCFLSLEFNRADPFFSFTVLYLHVY